MRYYGFLVCLLFAASQMTLSGCASVVARSEVAEKSVITWDARPQTIPPELPSSQVALPVKVAPIRSRDLRDYLRSEESWRKYVEEAMEQGRNPSPEEARWSCPIFAGAK